MFSIVQNIKSIIKLLIVSILMLLFLLIFIPKERVGAVSETRYMRDTTQTVNGLTSYVLATAQGTSSLSTYVQDTTGTTQTAYFGIRVWKRTSAGVETEITSGTPVAQVSRTTNASGLQTATWAVPATEIAQTDSVVARIYIQINAHGWAQGGTAPIFTSEVLGNSLIDNVTWTVSYYTQRSTNNGQNYTRGTLTWGTSTYNTYISSFTRTTQTITVGTSGTQVVNEYPGDTNNYIGGAFTLIRDSRTANVTSITITQTGTVTSANLTNLILVYKVEATCSATIPTGTTQFNSTPGTFSGGNSTVTGTISVSTSRICIYASLNIGSSATAGQTIDLQIANPSTGVLVSNGVSSPATAVSIAGTTTLVALTVTVGTTGTQVVNEYPGDTNNYIGGAFTIIRNSQTTNVTSIAVSQTGTVTSANLTNLILYYKTEASCSASIPSGTTQFNSTPGTFTAGTSTVTGSISVTTSQICIYITLDIGVSATAGQTIDLQITNPSTQVIVSNGTSAPATVVAIAGTTTLINRTVTVGTSGTQYVNKYPGATNENIGGAFTLIRDGGTANVTSFAINQTGTVTSANLTNMILYYKTEVSCSALIPTDATQFNSTPGTFTSGTSTVTGTISVTTSQICVYISLNISASATAGQTIDLRITNPSTGVLVSSGVTAPATAVAIAGTTTLVASGTLGVSVVDGSDVVVGSPSVSFSSYPFSWSIGQATGTLGISTQKIKIVNNTPTHIWTLSMAATGGVGAVYTTGTYTYNYNGTQAQGRLQVNPAIGTLTPGTNCDNRGLTLQSSAYFVSGSVNSINEVISGSTALTACYWYLTGVGLTQDIPAIQKGGNYSISMTLTLL